MNWSLGNLYQIYKSHWMLETWPDSLSKKEKWCKLPKSVFTCCLCMDLLVCFCFQVSDALYACNAESASCYQGNWLIWEIGGQVPVTDPRLLPAECSRLWWAGWGQSFLGQRWGANVIFKEKKTQTIPLFSCSHEANAVSKTLGLDISLVRLFVFTQCQAWVIFLEKWLRISVDQSWKDFKPFLTNFESTVLHKIFPSVPRNLLPSQFTPHPYWSKLQKQESTQAKEKKKKGV